jgi:hypothetical protein
MTKTPDFPKTSVTWPRSTEARWAPFPSLGNSTPSLFIRLAPIIFFVTYLTVTVLLFAFGPWPYRVNNGVKLYTFLAAAHIALLTGYLSVIKRRAQGYGGRWSLKKVVLAALIVNFALLIPSAMFRVGTSPKDVITGTASLGEAYSTSNVARVDKTPVIEYVRFLFGPLLALLLPLAVFYWHVLPKRVRVFSLLFVFAFVGMFVLMGTNAGLALMLLECPWLFVASKFAGYRESRKTQWHVKLAIAVGATASVILFFFFFAATQISRQGAGFTGEYTRAGDVYADDENFMIRNLEGVPKIGVLSLTSYLTQGYYAVDLAFDKPWVPTFGVGNSFFLTRQAVRITGVTSLEQAPYPMRIEDEGWDAFGEWSTIYPWIASDVSFPGTIVVVFLIGRLFALCWLDTLEGENPFAVGMFAQFIIMLSYFNANNQCLSGGEGLSGFVVLLILWLSTRRKLPAHGARRKWIWN